MAEKYKAFISYRHKPLDMKYAEKVHKTIEHYTIPKQLRKNGEKKPGVVFRDKDELPISGNLSDNIYTALDRSEYLIVICTPDTPESQWVSSEISYFLKHHDYSHVLSVLVDGTPEQSFPDALTHLYDEEGNLINIVEPLAANIVADSERQRTRLFNTEKIRILAALIGCEFNDLFRREQRYKIRQTALALSGIIAILGVFIGVLINRNAQIQKNYEQSLRNQSTFLATEAISKLNSGDRLNAIALALEALPSVDRDIPLVSKAEYALSLAVNAYLASGNATGLSSSGIVTQMSAISDFQLSNDQKYLISRSYERVACWDVDTMMQKWHINIDEWYNTEIIGFDHNNNALIFANDAIYSVNIPEASPVWIKTLADYSSSVRYDSHTDSEVVNEGHEIILLTSRHLLKINASDGSLIQLFDLPNEDYLAAYSSDTAISEDGNTVAIKYGSKSGSYDGFIILDTNTGEIIHRIGDMGEYDTALLYPSIHNNRLYVFIEPVGDDSSYSMGNFSYYTTNDCYINCYDLTYGTHLWSLPQQYTTVSYAWINKFADDIWDVPVAIFGYSNILLVLDAETGREITRAELPDALVSVDIANNRAWAITTGGELCSVYPGKEKSWNSQSYFTGPITNALFYPGNVWVQKNGSASIVHYSATKSDPTWFSNKCDWLNTADYFYEDDTEIGDEYYALLDGTELLIGQGKNSDTMTHVSLPQVSENYNEKRNYQLLRFEDNMLTMAWNQPGKFGFGYLNADTSDLKILEWPDMDMILWKVYYYDNDQQWYGIGYKEDSATGYLRFHVLKFDRDLNITASQEICMVSSTDKIDTVDFTDNMKTYIYSADKEKTYLIDFRTLKVSEASADLSASLGKVFEKDGKFENKTFGDDNGQYMAVLTGEKELELIDLKTGRSTIMTPEVSRFVSYHFTDDSKYLITLEEDGYARIYDARTAKILYKTVTYSSNSSLPSSEDVRWQDTSNGFIILYLDRMANLISTSDWGVFAYVPYCYGYMEKQDFFVSYDYVSAKREYGGFPRHDLNWLIEYGKERLNGWELTDDQKMQYGIN